MTWREDYAKEAYYDGKQAFRDGKGDNPHPMGSFERAAWARGYEMAGDLTPLQALQALTRVLEGGS